MANGGPTYVFRPMGRLYVCDMSEHETAWPELACVSDGGAAAPPAVGDKRAAQDPDTAQASAGRTQGAVDNVATVQDNAARYTKREMAAANEARDLMTRFKGVPSADIIKMMRDGLQGTSVLPQDITRAVDVWGQPIADFKGRSTAAKAPAIPQEQPHVVRVHQEFHTDLLFVSGQPYVLTLMQPMHYLFVAPTKSKSAPDLLGVIVKQMRSARARGIQITMLRCDRESAVVAIEADLNAEGVTLNTTAEGGAVPAVERCVRQIKERLRGVINTLPFDIGRGALLSGAVINVVQIINMVPTATSPLRISPREQLTGRKLNAARDVPMAFGQYCQCSHMKTDNSMDPRTISGVYMYSAGNLEGSKTVLNLATGCATVRQHCTPLPMPQGVIERLSEIAEAQGGTDDRDLRLLFGTMMQEADEMGVRRTFPHWRRAPALAPLPTPSETEYVPDDPHAPSMTLAEAVRTAQAAAQQHHSAHADAVTEEWEYGMHLSVTAAINEHGEPAVKAVVKEMLQLFNKGVWTVLDANALSYGDRKAILPSRMFLKEKFTADGEFDRMKARLVAGGDRQPRPEHAEETAAPTMGTSSLFIILALGAKDGCAIASADVPGAYLEADMTKRVLMRLDKFLAEILANIDPTLRPLMKPDGTFVVVLNKALYGCIESALLWYKVLRGVLEAIGFAANPYDPCVFIRVREGHTFTIGCYVDDLMLIGHCEEAVDGVVGELTTTFPGLAVHRGRTLNYVGMTMDMTEPKVCKITMAGFVTELMAECTDISGTADTPSTATLFEISPTAALLGERELKRFHSLVAKLLYLGKRSRPDILTTVAFLSTRVLKATEEDWKKLVKLVRYLRGTERLGIRLEANDPTVVMAYVDASFGVHADMRSHSGVVISLGRGPVYASSSRQRINTKSSTEAELVAVSDAYGQVIWTRNFVAALGQIVGPVQLQQDNLSTMALLRNGRSNSSRTRHIDIRYFFMSDRMAAGEVVVAAH
jgi:hypothetical protein